MKRPPFDPVEAARVVGERSRREQGLPSTITDPEAIARIAELIAPHVGVCQPAPGRRQRRVSGVDAAA